MIIGITGKNASGKGEIAKYLAQKNYLTLSLSDALREEATARGIDHTREELIKLGNHVREQFGPGFLGHKIGLMITEKVEKEPGLDVSVDSIRSPHEVNELRKLDNFFLISVDAPQELRFERAQKRNRTGDGTTLEEFRRHEAMEESTNDAGQQVSATMRLADVTIHNDSSLEYLYQQVDKAITTFEKNTPK